MIRFLILFFVAAVALTGADRPQAAAGFKWKSYAELYCDIQIPTGWHEQRTTAGLTQIVKISPTQLKAGEALGTGFTMNVVKVKTQ